MISIKCFYSLNYKRFVKYVNSNNVEIKVEKISAPICRRAYP